MPLRLLIFFTAINILNYFDRYIVHAVEPLLKSEFGLSNSQSGVLSAAFVVGYVVFSPLFGYLGDRVDKRILMAAGLFAWSLFTGLAGFASGFYSFIAARSLVGIGEASFGAIVPGYLKSRIPDTIALNSALSLFYVAIPVGSALGYVAGGVIGEHWGWRPLFFAAAVPGLALVAGFCSIAAEPSVKQVASEREGFFKGVRRIISSPVLRLTIVGYVFNTFALNGVAFFVARYGKGLGMEVSQVDRYFGGILVVTGILGALGGGRLASKFAARSPFQVRALLRFVSITTLIGVPFLGAAFMVDAPESFFVACFFAELALFAGVAPLNSVLVSRAPQGLETLTQGVTIFAIQMLGGALAPVLIGGCVDFLVTLEGRFSMTEGAALGYALQLSTLSMVFSGVFWWMAALAERE